MKPILIVLGVAFVMLAAVEPAQAAPIVGIVSAIATGASALSAIGSAILGIAINFGVSLLQKALQPDQKPAGVKLDVEIGDDIPVSTTIGTYATAGKRKYINTYDGNSKNSHLVLIYELGNLPSGGLAGLWIDDKKVTLDETVTTDERGFPVKEFRRDDKNYAWVRFYDGTQTAADAFLISKFKDDEDRPWKSTMIGRGIPYAIVTYRFNPELFTSVPECLFEMRPVPLYDIRRDSTMGGNGSHRWSNPATWEPSNNLVLMAYNVARGLFYNGEWFFGGQDLAASRLPASSWIAAAQEAARAMPIAGSTSTEPQFRGGFEITGDMEPLEVLQHFCSASNGSLIEVGGALKMTVGVPGAPVFSFTDGDIIITKGQTFEPFPALDETVNKITISYPEPEEKWASKDAPSPSPKDVDDDVTGLSLFEVDGDRELPIEVQLPATPFKRQVQRIRRAMLKEERRFRTHQFWLPPAAWVLEPGDVVSWSSDRNGYENKRFKVIAIEGEMTMNQQVTIREINPADYDWSADFELPTAAGYVGPMRNPTQPMVGWEVEAGVIPDASGKSRRPAIFMRCSGDLDDVKRVKAVVRVKATGKVVKRADNFPYEEPFEWPLSGAWLLPNVTYEVRGQLVLNNLRRRTETSEWLTVTAPDVRFSAEDFHLEEVTQQVQQELTSLETWIWGQSATRKLIDDIQAIGRSLVEQDLANFSDKQTIRREVAVRTGAMQASFDERILVATSATEALSGRVETFQAKIDSKADASVVSEVVARVTATEGTIMVLSGQVETVSSQLGDKADASAVSALATSVSQQGGRIDAQASLLTDLSAQVGEVSADARLRFEVVNNSGGTGYSVIGLQARFGTAESYRSAGLFIKVTSDPGQPSQVIVNADRFAVAAGNNENGATVFAVDGDGVFLKDAYIRNITTAKVTFLDGSVLTSALAQNAATKVLTRADASETSYTSTGQKTVDHPGINLTTSAADSLLIEGKMRYRQSTAGASTIRVALYVNDFLVDTDEIDFATGDKRKYLSVSHRLSSAGLQRIRLFTEIVSITGQVTRDRYRLDATLALKGASSE